MPELVECVCGRLVNVEVNCRCPAVDCGEPLDDPLEVDAE